MSTRRHTDGGWTSPSELGPDGRRTAGCRRCGGAIPEGRRTFCSSSCVHEHRMRTDGGYARQKVWERDEGRCELCGRSARRLERFFRRAKQWVGAVTSRIEHVQLGAFGRHPYERAQRRREIVARMWSRPWRIAGMRVPPLDLTVFWEADHRIPVIEGGGECGLANLRTLCWWCHKEETAALARRRARRRRDEAEERSGQVRLPGLDASTGGGGVG